MFWVLDFVLGFYSLFNWISFFHKVCTTAVISLGLIFPDTVVLFWAFNFFLD